MARVSSKTIAPVAAPVANLVGSAAAYKAHATMCRTRAIKARGQNRADLLAKAEQYDALAAQVIGGQPVAKPEKAPSNQRAAAYKAWATMTREKAKAARGQNRADLLAKAAEFDAQAAAALT